MVVSDLCEIVVVVHPEGVGAAGGAPLVGRRQDGQEQPADEVAAVETGEEEEEERQHHLPAVVEIARCCYLAFAVAVGSHQDVVAAVVVDWDPIQVCRPVVPGLNRPRRPRGAGLACRPWAHPEAGGGRAELQEVRHRSKGIPVELCPD